MTRGGNAVRRLGGLFVIPLMAILVLAGCGSSDDPGSGQKSITAPAGGDSSADLASACWNDSDRVTSSEGDNSVAGQLQWKEAPAMAIDPAKKYAATVETNKGSFTVEFFPDDAPKTVNNFICLARAGYYDNTPFHRVMDGFMIQGGDPTGTGRGGPGYKFNDEPIKRNYELGTLAMANAGPNTNGSQFFVVVGQSGMGLPKNYTIFGKVTTGMDIVNSIAKSPVKNNGQGEVSVPVEPLTIQKVTVAES